MWTRTGPFVVLLGLLGAICAECCCVVLMTVTVCEVEVGMARGPKACSPAPPSAAGGGDVGRKAEDPAGVVWSLEWGIMGESIAPLLAIPVPPVPATVGGLSR